MGNSRVLDGDRGYRYAFESPPESYKLPLQLYSALGFATLYALHLLIKHLDLALLSPLEVIWNVFVYLVPCRLIAILAKITHTKDADVELDPTKTASQHLAMKSQALRHLLRINSAASLSHLGLSGAKSLQTQNASKTFSMVPPGLGNWDNSCYQNSILQSLAALDCMVKFLGRSVDSFISPTDTTTDALHKLSQSLSGSSLNGKRLWTPTKLKSMSSWQQQDAQEYFSRVLDDIEKELRATTRRKAGGSGFKNVAKAIQSNMPLRVESCSRAASSIPLEGLLGQRVACVACGYTEGVSLLPFNCLTVSLGSRQRYSLEELLLDYTKLESIEGVECLSCTFQRHAKRLAAMLDPGHFSSPDGVGSASPSKTQLSPSIQTQISARLEDVRAAIESQEFSDKVAAKCAIGKDARISSTKTKQVVVARPPQALAIHVNRSIFDENTGAMAKNLAYIAFPKILSLQPWTLGQQNPDDRSATETWPCSPTISMATQNLESLDQDGPRYQLKAVVTHFGRHENGHYICYRQHNTCEDKFKDTHKSASAYQTPDDFFGKDRWWRLSDDNVTQATEDEVLHQGGVFMLFYEKIPTVSTPSPVIDPVAISTSGEINQPEIHDEGACNFAGSPIKVDTIQGEDSDDIEAKQRSPLLIAESAKQDEPRIDFSQLANSLPQLEQAATPPQRLRTSRAKRGKGKTHLSPGRQIVTAQ